MTGNTFFDVVASPIGDLRVTSDGENLTGIWMMDPGEDPRRSPDWVRSSLPFERAKAQLDAYFAGELTTFDLPLAPRGTDFQLRVWEGLRSIPYGRAISYAELARRIGEPKAVRAVGAANGRNPLPIVLPCHRVIGADGSLTGYGGGLDRKRTLLELEGFAVDGSGRRGQATRQAELFA